MSGRPGAGPPNHLIVPLPPQGISEDAAALPNERTLPLIHLPSALPLVDAELLRALHLHDHPVLDDGRHRPVAQPAQGGADEIEPIASSIVRRPAVAVQLRPHPCSSSVEASGRVLPHLRRACRGARVGSQPSEKPSTASTHLPHFPTRLLPNRRAKVERRTRRNH